MAYNDLPVGDLQKTTKTRFEAPLPVMRKLISSLRLFPKTHDFFGYFERSIENTVIGAKMLQRMISHKEERHELSKQLKECEHAGDKITHEVIDLLRETFLTPFDRSDMYNLAVKLDDILDIVNFIGNRLTRYNIDKMPKEVGLLSDIVLQASQELSKALLNLRNMKHSQKVLEHCIEINRLENEADELVNSSIDDLFSNNWHPLDIIKIKEMVENLETAADKCEEVANVIEGIILKHS